MKDLWNHDEPVSEHIDVPAWIDKGITGATLEAIMQGGCASGAYMPAVTYWQAKETMNEHGDDILQLIEDHYGELPQPRSDESWSGLAVHYLSIAVEYWAHGAAEELKSALHEIEDAASGEASVAHVLARRLAREG